MSTTDKQILPTFLIVGAAKSGTTAVYHWLNQHPGVFMSPVKEPHFFSGLQPTYRGPGDDRFNQPIVTEWEEYLALFASARGFSVRGEASPSYLDLYPAAVPSIQARVPGIKIVIILRHPTDRAFSEYVHLVRDGRETKTFGQSLDAEAERMRAGWRRIWAHKARGLYYEAVSAYIDGFGRENVGVWLYETLRERPAATFREMCRFIGAEEDFVPQFSQVNVGGVPRVKLLHRWLNGQGATIRLVRWLLPSRFRTSLRQSVERVNLSKLSVSAEDREYLDAYYREDIARLHRLLPEVNFSPWDRHITSGQNAYSGARAATAR